MGGSPRRPHHHGAFPRPKDKKSSSRFLSSRFIATRNNSKDADNNKLRTPKLDDPSTPATEYGDSPESGGMKVSIRDPSTSPPPVANNDDNDEVMHRRSDDTISTLSASLSPNANWRSQQQQYGAGQQQPQVGDAAAGGLPLNPRDGAAAGPGGGGRAGDAAANNLKSSSSAARGSNSSTNEPSLFHAIMGSLSACSPLEGMPTIPEEVGHSRTSTTTRGGVGGIMPTTEGEYVRPPIWGIAPSEDEGDDESDEGHLLVEEELEDGLYENIELVLESPSTAAEPKDLSNRFDAAAAAGGYRGGGRRASSSPLALPPGVSPSRVPSSPSRALIEAAQLGPYDPRIGTPTLSQQGMEGEENDALSFRASNNSAFRPQEAPQQLPQMPSFAPAGEERAMAPAGVDHGRSRSPAEMTTTAAQQNKKIFKQQTAAPHSVQQEREQWNGRVEENEYKANYAAARQGGGTNAVAKSAAETATRPTTRKDADNGNDNNKSKKKSWARLPFRGMSFSSGKNKKKNMKRPRSTPAAGTTSAAVESASSSAREERQKNVAATKSAGKGNAAPGDDRRDAAQQRGAEGVKLSKRGFGRSVRVPAVRKNPSVRNNAGKQSDTGPSSSTAAAAADEKTTAAAPTAEELAQAEEAKRWRAVKDRASGNTYYYHVVTKETTWEKPPGFVERKKKKKGVAAGPSGTDATTDERNGANSSSKDKPVGGSINKSAAQDSRALQSETVANQPVQSNKTKATKMLFGISPNDPQKNNKILKQYEGKEDVLIQKLQDIIDETPFDEDPSVSGLLLDVDAREDQPVSTDAARVPKKDLAVVENTANDRNATINDVSGNRRESQQPSQTDQSERVRSREQLIVSKAPLRDSSELSSGLKTRVQTLQSEQTDRTRQIANTTTSVFDKLGHRPEYSQDMNISMNTSLSSAPDLSRRDYVLDIGGNDREKYGIDRKRELTAEEFNGNDYGLKTEKYGAKAGATRRVVDSRIPGEGTPEATRVQEPEMAPDYDSYAGDYDDDGYGADSTTWATDSVSALSTSDAGGEFTSLRSKIGKKKRKELDNALKERDWDRAASVADDLQSECMSRASSMRHEPSDISFGELSSYKMPENKDDIYQHQLIENDGKPKEWTQTDLDMFISQNDWTSVARYIAEMRSHTIPAAGGASAQKKNPNRRARASRNEPKHQNISIVKRDGRYHRSHNYEQSQPPESLSPRKRFGARSQLQHDDIASDDSSYYDERDEETDASDWQSMTSASSYGGRSSPGRNGRRKMDQPRSMRGVYRQMQV